MSPSSWSTRTIIIVLCVALLAQACVGPFNMTASVLDWNRSTFENEWAQEGMFLVFVIIPVYGVTIFLDAIIFNSIEFWTGDNPIDPPGGIVEAVVEG
jgi:hypothetical protein